MTHLAVRTDCDVGITKTTSQYHDSRSAVVAAPQQALPGYDEWCDELEGSGQAVLFPFSVEQRFRRAGVWVTQTVALCRSREDAWAILDLMDRPLGYYYAIREAV